jgi:amino-acid N-acetyltransferase
MQAESSSIWNIAIHSIGTYAACSDHKFFKKLYHPASRTEAKHECCTTYDLRLTTSSNTLLLSINLHLHLQQYIYIYSTSTSTPMQDRIIPSISNTMALFLTLQILALLINPCASFSRNSIQPFVTNSNSMSPPPAAKAKAKVQTQTQTQTFQFRKRTAVHVAIDETGFSEAAATPSPIPTVPSASAFDSAPFSVDSSDGSFYEDIDHVFKHELLSVHDPALVEFAASEDFYNEPMDLEDLDLANSPYPLAAMMQTSAQYIAAHAGEISVFHLSGDLLEQESTDEIISDMALAWLLGMKIVLVVGCRYDTDGCDLDMGDHPHECHNILKVTDAVTLRSVEEEAGYLRTEVERKLNRCLRPYGPSTSSNPDCPSREGNVVSGNFYTANRFGVVKGQDFQFTGCVTQVHSENIEQVLDNNDVVLLTTVGYSAMGELVNVNGYHLAASVAASLHASKLVYMANAGSILKKKGEDRPLQEFPLSFAKSITDYHNVQVHNTGFATFEMARQALDAPATELLLHLGWASWALENGVQRAHIVNPGDGALLEELFTSKNGANTCVYHDEESPVEESPVEEGDVAPEDWNEFFESAAAQGQDVASFN